MRQSFRSKILLWFGASLSLSLICLLGYAAQVFRADFERSITAKRKQARSEARLKLSRLALELSDQIEHPILSTANSVSNLARLARGIKDPNIGLDLEREQFQNILLGALEHSPQLRRLLTIWEPDAFDGMDGGFAEEDQANHSGRFAIAAIRSGTEQRLAPVAFASPEAPDHKAYIQARKLQEVTALKPQRSASGHWSLLISAPVRVGESYYGQVSAELDLAGASAMLEACREQFLGSAAWAALLDSDGATIIAESGQRSMGKATQSLRELDLTAAKSQVFDNGDELLAVRPLPLPGKLTKLFLVSSTPTATAFAPVAALTKTLAAESRRRLMRLVQVGALIIVIAMACVFYLARQLSQPIVTLTRDIAEGKTDLTRSLEQQQTSAELATLSDSYNTHLELLRTAVSLVADNAEGTSRRAIEASHSTEDINMSVQSVAAAIEELSSSIEEVARNGETAYGLMREASSGAEDSHLRMTELARSSGQIGEMTKLISQIAHKTTMLAINASIEAAHAGDRGLGFGAVADEVKQLALSSSDASREIAKFVQAVQADIVEMSSLIDLSTRRTEVLTDTLATVAAALEEQSATTNMIAVDVGFVATGSAQIMETVSSVAALAESTTQQLKQFRY